MDDDDDFLYGTSVPTPSVSAPPTANPIQVSQPSPIETGLVSNGLVSHLEAAAEDTTNNGDTQEEAEQETEEGEAEAEEDSEEDEDIEIIMDQPSRSLDFRQNRPAPNRAPSSAKPPTAKPQLAGPLGTTEYTPLQRGVSSASIATQPSQTNISASTQVAPAPSTTPASAPPQAVDDGVDTSNLPPALAPPSHPQIDPAAVGSMDGRSILDVDLSALADKPWRKPGSDISDWFNYGFDEVSWEAYCYRRRDLGDLAHVLKTSVLNFSGMPEEQVTALPPEVRQMVMTGTNAMLNNNGPNPAMMGMMDMGMMHPMAMEMGMMSSGMMPDGSSGPGANGTPEPIMQEGYPSGGGQGMMNQMGEYGMQDQMYQGMEPQAQVVGPSGRGAAAGFRGRGGLARAPRGFARGRGGRTSYGAEGGIPRPASPLPPNVPTGPRNQNKYKDRDGNAPAVDGLDYGAGGRIGSGEPEERGRKRRGSPSMEDSRSSKRR